MAMPRAAADSRSAAFRRAALASEERRAYAVMFVIVLVALPFLMFVRSARPVEAAVRVVAAGAGLTLIVIELLTIALARQARRVDRRIPTWLSVLGVVSECCVPTTVILAHVHFRTLAPYAALMAPPSLAYCVLIALTTLRLRPMLCLLGGFVAAAGYGSAVLYVVFCVRAPLTESALPWPGYVMAAMMILATGFAAAWVAREIRTYVEAALDEAETRRRMERVEQDLLAAQTIQQSLLPRASPQIEGFDIAAWNRPADQTGGDYYDWQSLPDGNWIVTLADVSGHGIGPALVTAACRAYMRASSAQHRDLASLAARVNALLADDLPDGRFVTMVNVLLQPGHGTTAVLSCGHGPIVVYVHATGQTQSVEPHGLPLAVVAELELGPAEPLTLAPGDVIALITDGFVEWARPDAAGEREEFGMERLTAALARHAQRPAAEIIRAVTAEVEAFAGATPQQDDLTMVIIRREPADDGAARVGLSSG